MTAAPDSPLATLWCPSPNREPRRNDCKLDMLILHYTGMESAEAALDWLTRQESGVSCHYFVDEKGRIAQLVREDERAWHAGQSLWAGETDTNSCSIGIEIHNPGHDFDYPDFTEAQMQALEALCLDICSRHPIPPHRVLAHSDVAPMRKKDPGEKFPWDRLARAGIGHWVEPQAVVAAEPGMGIGVAGPLVAEVQQRLRNERESQLIYYRYALDIKPRDICKRFPQEFPHVDEVHTMTQNILARLRRDPELRKFLGDGEESK